MINSFNHKGLRLFFETGNKKGIPAEQAKKIQVRLNAIDIATVIDDIAVAGWYLHELKGERAGTWAIRVTGNYRITFRFINGDASQVDLEDYH